MTKLSKLLKKPKLFFKDIYKNKLEELSMNIKYISKKVFRNFNSFEKFLIFFVMLLGAFSFTYYYLISRNKFLVSSSIVIRKSEGNSQISYDLAGLFGGISNQSSLDESKYLEVYLKSPEMLEKLDEKLNFSSIYSKKGLDLFSGIGLNPSNDIKYDFFTKQISVFTNQENGVLEIKVKAFSPEEALAINNFLISQSEIFVNELNYEISKKQLEFTRKEVNLAKERLDFEKNRLKKLQTKYNSLDLGFEAKSISKMIIALEEEIIKLKIKLAEKKRAFVSNDVPEIKFIENQISSLREQIELERSKLVSENDNSLNKKSSELKEIKSNILFFEELYRTTLARSESNRIDSIQQQKFLVVLSKPFKPDTPWQSWRHRSFLTFMSCVIIFIALLKFIFGISASHND